MSKAKSLPVWELAQRIVAAKTREEKQAIAALCEPRYLQLLRNAVKALVAKQRAAKPPKPVPDCFVRIKTKLKQAAQVNHGKTRTTNI
ncbi:hypothetical protein HG263_06720 [Pseudoalteromonas sp. JBTF-M23]|uniref:Uncharacterized protein n=1 Tax=Pseudoalteromonas caenipelagi TaxID=2726988 RepID=A0A849VB68_9GAMM|nr:hypothetical protein [Pseudoalteromonas caenipelagi]NOU50235.1 hypothetical protein [Pseudoalteromonas caenipelagi]